MISLHLIDTRAMIRPLLTSLLLFTFAIAATPSLAEEPPISSYTAHFDATVAGIKMGEIERSLKLNQDGLYELTTLIYTTGLLSVFRPDRFEEHSFWRWQDNAPVPVRYTYHYSGNKGDVYEQLDFNWEKMQVKSLRDGKTTVVEIEQGVVDKLSYQVALVRDLRLGKKEFAYQVADRGKVRTISYKVIGEEKLDTPWGQQQTIKVERVTDSNERITILWFAPDLDFMVVRLVQNDSGTKMSATIKELVIEGMKLVKRPVPGGDPFTSWPID